MSKKSVHVTPHKGGGWQVKKGGNQKASALTPTQQTAINIGRGMAINDKTELFIHGKDGKIRDADSYGNDPNPPRDTKH